MKNATKISLAVLAATVISMILAGCAKVPQSEVDAAKAALESAKTAEAPVYAVDSYKIAENTVAALDQELIAQEKIGSIKRKYDKAMTLAVDAKTAGEKAALDATQAKTALKAEVSGMIAAVQALLPEAKDMVEKASKVKGVKLDVKALTAEMETGATILIEAQNDLDAGKLMDAKNKVVVVQEQLAAGDALVKAAVDLVSKTTKKK